MNRRQLNQNPVAYVPAVYYLHAYVNWNKVVQSNLGTGRVATLGDRPIHSPRAQSFNRICQVVLRCAPI